LNGSDFTSQYFMGVIIIFRCCFSTLMGVIQGVIDINL